MLEFLFLLSAAVQQAGDDSVGQAEQCPSGYAAPETERERGDRMASRIRADYPPDALQAGREGTVVMRLTIGCDGQVKRCRVVKSSGTGSLDRAACVSIFKYAVFAPATDDRGQTVESETEFSYTYALD